mmetsp:Transcript_4872/g.8144  ORF Transcript_4872/g.8144 Transcript_4872/m.8144 type:complete len:89 (+) Transcript_4872:436-702(+)
MERDTGCPPPMKRRGVFVTAAVNEFPDDEGRRRALRRLLEPRVTKLREKNAKDMVGIFSLLYGYQPPCLIEVLSIRCDCSTGRYDTMH